MDAGPFQLKATISSFNILRERFSKNDVSDDNRSYLSNFRKIESPLNLDLLLSFVIISSPGVGSGIIYEQMILLETEINAEYVYRYFHFNTLIKNIIGKDYLLNLKTFQDVPHKINMYECKYSNKSRCA